MTSEAEVRLCREHLDLLPTLFILLDGEGKVRDANRAALKLLGLGHQEIIGRDWFQSFIPLEVAAATRNTFDCLMRGEIAAAEEHENEVQSLAGQRYLIAWKNGFSRDTTGRISGTISFGVDVTEERRTQQELARHRNLLHTMLESMGDGVIATDLDGAVTYLNPVAENLTGWRSAEALGRKLPEVFPISSARSGARVDNPVSMVLSSGRTVGLANDTVLTSRDGSRYQIADSAAPLRSADGSVNGVILIFRDVSAAYAQAEALRLSEERFRSVVESNPLGVHLYQLMPDDRLIFLGANPAADQILGVENSRYIGKSIEEAFPPLTQTEIPDAYRRVARTGKPFETEQITYQDDEITGAFEVRAFQIGPGRMAALFADVTERRRSEAERQRLFDLSLDLIAVGGFDGYLKDVNPAWTKILGWTREEMLSRPWLDFVHPDDVATTIAAAEQLIRGQEVVGFRNRYRAKDGTFRWLGWNSQPLTKERLIYAVVRDETEQEQMRDRLAQAEKLQAIGQLAGGVAHDFNNQLVGVMGCADLLRQSLVDRPDLSQLASLIIQAAERSATLTGQLLAFARKGKYDQQLLSLHRVIGEAVTMLERTIDRRIRIELQLEPGQPMIMGDKAQLQNAFINLGINARDAMPDGGELVISTERVVLDGAFGASTKADLAAGEYVTIVFCDTGVGMPADVLPHIFEPFFTTKEAGKGTGLGLAAVYGIVTRHGGAVDVESSPERGSAFRIWLPLAPADARQDKVSLVADASGVVGLRVLLVDDDQTVVAVASTMLENLGHRVICRSSGQAALDYFAMHKDEIGLIILDMIMPDLTGREVLEALRSMRSDVPVILSSGYVPDQDLRQMVEAGLVGFIPKPYLDQDLEAAITRVGSLTRGKTVA